MNTQAAVLIDRVSKQFGSLQALDGISLRVEAGEFFALLGPNGAGKTTLISAMAGLLRPDQGSISIMGHDVIQAYRLARMSLGVVPQELVFDPFLTVRETLRFQSGYFGLTRNDAWIDELLFKLDLQEKAFSNMRSLSGGMKRRVMVAQALVHRPPAMVLDEPTAGVDVALRQSLWKFIRELNQKGHTIILTTHYLEEAETLCNRIAMLKRGRLLALENKTVLLNRSAERKVWIKLSKLPPEGLETFSPQPMEEGFVFRLTELSQLEPILACLRQHAIEVRELSVIQEDLEHVFVKMMGAEEL